MLCLPFFVVAVTHPSLLGESGVSVTAPMPSFPKELGSTTLMTSVTVRYALDTSFVIVTPMTGCNFVLSLFSEVKYICPHQIMSCDSQTRDVTRFYILKQFLACPSAYPTNNILFLNHQPSHLSCS